MLPALCFAFALTASRAFAAPYVVTTYVQISVYSEDGFTDRETTEAPTAYTYTEDVVPATPISAITTLTTTGEYSEVTLVEIVVASGAEVSYTEAGYDATALQTLYVVPITYTPTSTCTSQNWTFSTNVPINIPSIVSLSPVTVSTSVSIWSYYELNPTSTTEIIAVLNPTDVSAEDFVSASIEYQPDGIQNCYTPTTYCAVLSATGTAAQCTATFVPDDSYNYGDGFYDDGDDNTWIRNIILIAVLVPVGWWLIWLCIGFYESWLSFKGLMLGRHRKRGLPYSWCCISILFLCWTGPTYKAKSAEEQTRLGEQWDAMPAGQKFKLWMKWGFRWKYPVDVLGEEPEIAKRAFRQGCL